MSNWRRRTYLVITAALLWLACPLAFAYDPSTVNVTGLETPKELQGIGITEKLGDTVDLSLPFVDDHGKAVHLGRYFQSHKPVLLSIVYYSCPNLCNFHLNGVTEALKKIPWNVGNEFELVAVSMDASEKSDVAAPKKANYIKMYGRPETADGWHFLTGDEASIRKLADQVGFGFRWDENEKQFAHASAAIILTPGGSISRYLPGITVEPSTLKLSLLEASGGKIGTILDKVVMFCFHFDPRKSKYTIYAWKIMQMSALFMILIMAAFFLPKWLRRKTA